MQFCGTRKITLNFLVKILRSVVYFPIVHGPPLVTGCNPNDLDIWMDWCRLGLQFVVYRSAEQEWSFVN